MALNGYKRDPVGCVGCSSFGHKLLVFPVSLVVQGRLQPPARVPIRPHLFFLNSKVPPTWSLTLKHVLTNCPSQSGTCMRTTIVLYYRNKLSQSIRSRNSRKIKSRNDWSTHLDPSPTYRCMRASANRKN